MITFLILSCAHLQTPIISQEQYNYALDIDADFDDDGSNIDIQMHLKLNLKPLKKHRDDSLDYRLQVQEFHAVIGEQPQADTLSGKYVLVRAFEHGELLSVKHLEEWSSQTPYLAAIDVLWFALYPNPPQIQEKVQVGTTRFSLAYTSEQKGYVRYRSTWNLEKTTDNINLKYEAKSILKGSWRDMILSGHGQVQGAVQTRESGGIPLDHKGVLTREVCYHSVQKKCQQQTVHFSLKEL